MITSQPSLTFPIINTGISMKNRIKYLPLVIAFALTGCGGSDSNDAPEFTSNLTFTLDEDTSITGQVVAADDDAVSYTLGSAASNGLFALNADGTFTYTPKENFAGQDTVTVTATDGSLSTDAVLTFTVNNINDAPTLTSQSITVTTSTTTEGSLTFNDADGDTVTVSLVTPPTNGALTLDEQTGAFTFTAETLSEINDSFVIEFTDGNISSPISAIIELKPSYVTNEDKLNYYYSSDKSHLKQAEAISENINDDIYMDEVNTQLAIGYLIAGFAEKADEHFNKITAIDTKANAYLDAAKSLDLINLSEKALTFRQDAATLYNQYLAEKGLDNISNSDPGFYLTLTNQYNAAGQTEAAQAMLDTLKLYANEVYTEEYNKTYIRFISAIKKTVESSKEQYAATQTETVRNEGVKVTQAMADLSEKIGYFIQKSGDYKGQPTERMRALYITWSAQSFIQLNEVDLAKYYTNLALSYYGVVGFDNTYSFNASPYAEATLASYTYPLEVLTANIKALYDVELSNNPAFALLTDQDDKDDAVEYSFAYEVANKLQAGNSIDDAVQNAKEYFMSGESPNAISFYQTLITSSGQPGAADILRVRGENELGLVLANYAADILFSEEYILSQTSPTYITDRYGCAGLVDLAIALGNEQQAKNYAQRCSDIIDTYFIENNTNFTTDTAAYALNHQLATFGLVSQPESIAITAEKLNTLINLFDKKQTQIEWRLSSLGYLVQAGLIDMALNWLDISLTTLQSEQSNLDINDYKSLLTKALYATLNTGEISGGLFESYSLTSSLVRFQVNNEQYASAYAETIEMLEPFVANANTFILLQDDKVIQSNLETLLTFQALLGNDAAVKELIEHSVNAEADKLSLTALYANLLAQRDDFPTSSIASIDTDHDGKPNFFLSGASEQAIADSGLIADNDADNDGIEDSIDLTPLGE